jgi:hypothetical protein
MTEDEARRILQLEEGSSPKMIREAYLHLVKVWHPDRFEHDPRLRARATRTLRDVNTAYAVLQHLQSASSVGADRSGNSPVQESNDVSPRVATRTALGVSIRRAIVLGAGFGVVVAIALAIRPLSTPAAADATALDPPTVADDNGAALPGPQRSAVPPAVPVDDRRPLSGVGLSPASQRGTGSVPIFNRGAHDAVVVLARDGVHVYASYVRAGEKVQIAGVAEGDYDVLLTAGGTWREDRFTVSAIFLARGKTLRVRDGTGERLVNATSTLVLPSVLPDAEFQTVETFGVRLP